MDNILEAFLFGDDIIPQVANAVVNLVNAPQNVPEGRGEITRNENYFEYTIPRYSDIQFREHFRMSRVTFQRLFNCIGHIHQLEDRIIPLEKKLMFTIWMLSKPESFLAAGDRFGLPKSSGHNIFSEIIMELGGLTPQYIRWPNMQNLVQTANVFEARSQGIPGVVGAIDGCHITIKQPVNNAIDFYNRKGFHSIILQGVCNERGVFTYVNIGRPGRMHDARVFRMSEIYDCLTRADPILPPNMHLIGDSAYPLLINLMKPYQNNGHLLPEQVNYNNKLSSIRSVVERSFGLLKCKFRRLKFLDTETIQMANRTVLAACVLHNFIILEGNVLDEYNIENHILNEDNNEGINYIMVGGAEQKRRDIVQQCYVENN